MYQILNVLIDPTTNAIIDSWNADEDEAYSSLYLYTTSVILSNGNVGVMWQDGYDRNFYGVVYNCNILIFFMINHIIFYIFS